MWIIQGPIIKLMTNAVIAADAERKVMYSNTFKNENDSLTDVRSWYNISFGILPK
jgi:peroxiredoxin